MVTLLAAAFFLLQAEPEQKSWEFHHQTAAPASPSKEAIETAPSKATLTVTLGQSAAFGSPSVTTKFDRGVVTTFEVGSFNNRSLKIDFIGGEVKYKRGDEAVMTRRLKNQPEMVVIERQEADPASWVHLVRGDKFRKLKKSETIRVPIYSVSFNTHLEADIQAAFFGEMVLAGSKGKVKARRYEVARDKTRWTIWADEAGDLVAMKTVAWVRGDERYMTTYQSRADVFDGPDVKAAPKD